MKKIEKYFARSFLVLFVLKLSLKALVEISIWLEASHIILTPIVFVIAVVLSLLWGGLGLLVIWFALKKA